MLEGVEGGVKSVMSIIWSTERAVLLILAILGGLKFLTVWAAVNEFMLMW